MSVVGIDIEATGALALLDEAGELIEVADMPILRDGPKNRPTANGPLLAEIIARWRPSRAFIEFVGARPGEGAVGAFAFGRSRGSVSHSGCAHCARRLEAVRRHPSGSRWGQRRITIGSYPEMARQGRPVRTR